MANIRNSKSAKTSQIIGGIMAALGILWFGAAARERGKYEAEENLQRNLNLFNEGVEAGEKKKSWEPILPDMMTKEEGL